MYEPDDTAGDEEQVSIARHDGRSVARDCNEPLWGNQL